MTYLVTCPLVGGGTRTDRVKADSASIEEGAIVLRHGTVVVFTSRDWLRAAYVPSQEVKAGQWIENVEIVLPPIQGQDGAA